MIPDVDETAELRAIQAQQRAALVNPAILDLPPAPRSVAEAQTLLVASQLAEIRTALSESASVGEAAGKLGRSPRTLRRWIKTHPSLVDGLTLRGRGWPKGKKRGPKPEPKKRTRPRTEKKSKRSGRKR